MVIRQKFRWRKRQRAVHCSTEQSKTIRESGETNDFKDGQAQETRKSSVGPNLALVGMHHSELKERRFWNRNAEMRNTMIQYGNIATLASFHLRRCLQCSYVWNFVSEP